MIDDFSNLYENNISNSPTKQIRMLAIEKLLCTLYFCKSSRNGTFLYNCVVKKKKIFNISFEYHEFWQFWRWTRSNIYTSLNISKSWYKKRIIPMYVNNMSSEFTNRRCISQSNILYKCLLILAKRQNFLLKFWCVMSDLCFIST